MKKSIIGLLLIAAVCQMKAQDIQVSRFERNYTSLIASISPVYDNTGEACAVIRFFVRDEGFIIEPNLGMMKQEVKPGEIRMWVPKGTKRLTVRNGNWMPLTGYEIPVVVEPKVTYDAELSITDEALQRKKSNKGHNVYMGLGYSITTLSGPSLSLGFDIKHHTIELGAIYGLNKSDDLYFYNDQASVTGAYNYQAIRLLLRYGYDIKLADFFSVTPLIGGAVNILQGNEVVKSSIDYSSGNSVSALGALRLVASLSNRFRLHITPEYQINISRNDNCWWLSQYDSTINSWTDGFNLSVGLMYFF